MKEPREIRQRDNAEARRRYAGPHTSWTRVEAFADGAEHARRQVVERMCRLILTAELTVEQRGALLYAVGDIEHGELPEVQP